MLLDLLGTNDPEPTVVSSQQSTHVSQYHTFWQLELEVTQNTLDRQVF